MSARVTRPPMRMSMLWRCGRRHLAAVGGGSLLLGAVSPVPTRCADGRAPTAASGCLPGDPLGTVMVLTVAGIVAAEYAAMVSQRRGLLAGAPVPAGQAVETEVAAALPAAAQAAKATPAGAVAPPRAAASQKGGGSESGNTMLYLGLLGAGLGAVALVVWTRQSSGAAVVAAAARTAAVNGGSAAAAATAAATLPAARKTVPAAGPVCRHSAVNAYLSRVYTRDRLPLAWTRATGPAAAVRSDAAVQSEAAAAVLTAVEAEPAILAQCEAGGEQGAAGAMTGALALLRPGTVCLSSLDLLGDCFTVVNDTASDQLMTDCKHTLYAHTRVDSQLKADYLLMSTGTVRSEAYGVSTAHCNTNAIAYAI